jgi:photosystem II stability/assembly factor-like uncharacterized protein
MRWKFFLLLAAGVAAVAAHFLIAASEPQSPVLRFEITTNLRPTSGRLFVIISRTNRPEPRFRIGETGMNAAPILGRDVKNFGPGVVATIDSTAATFPISSLNALPPDDYYVQALLDSNMDVRSVNAEGNSYSEVQRVRLDPRAGGTVRLALTITIPPEQLPPDDQYVKYVKIQSSLLTRFHGRPIYLRAGVILPRDYGSAKRRWPLRVHIGGYGTRYTAVQRLMSGSSEFRRMWLSDETPRFIYLQLDGDGPYGDSYQLNSDNNGPYGDAITRELIPYIEKRFSAIGEPYARVLDGESTGGWVSLALKVFYPDFFNAVWASCPDGIDFRGFQLINIYQDKNAYFDDSGAERPSKRDVNGKVEFTIRHECQMENVIGAGDSWTMSGQQWGAWNAVYGPRGANGRPVPLWDPKSGAINRAVVDHWKKYDLRMVLEQNWKTLGPKVRGKIHIAVGEADDYYLNNAVHMLDAFFQSANPPADARITYGPGRGHCWNNLSEAQLMRAMAAAVEQSNPKAPQWQDQKSGTTARLRGISAVDVNVAWASGNKGTVLRTVDGGEHWLSATIEGAGELDFRDVHGVDANTAYVLSAGEGEQSRIYKTADAGRHWTLQFANRDPKAFFDGFAFWDAVHGIAFSDPVDGHFVIIRTADGGATWQPIPRENMPPALPGEAAFAASGSSITTFGTNHVWIATGGSAARVFHSSDRGMTWSVAATPIMSGPPSAGIFSVYATSAQNLVAAGGDYLKEKESGLNFATSGDGGATWTAGPQLPGYRSAIHALSDRMWIATGPSGTDLLESDNGAWSVVGSFGYDALSFLPDRLTGWAVGSDGRIAKWKVNGRR